MLKMKAITVLVLVLCVTRTLAEDDFEKNTYRVALKVYDDCSKGEFFSCLKKKAIVMLDRLGRMENISLTEGVTIVKATEDFQEKSNSTGEDLERNISKEESLDEILLDKLTRLIGSRRLEISLPKLLPDMQGDDSDDVTNGQARGDFDISSLGGGGGGHGGGGHGGGGGGHGGGGGFGGGGGKKKKKGGDQMKTLMILLAAKMSMLGALAIGSLFFLAKKALITAKIALVISAIIGLKKLLAKKGGGTKVQDVWASPSHGGGHGGYGDVGGGGWGPSGGGGWDKKSFNALPYSAHDPGKYD